MLAVGHTLQQFYAVLYQDVFHKQHVTQPLLYKMHFYHITSCKPICTQRITTHCSMRDARSCTSKFLHHNAPITLYIICINMLEPFQMVFSFDVLISICFYDPFFSNTFGQLRHQLFTHEAAVVGLPCAPHQHRTGVRRGLAQPPEEDEGRHVHRRRGCGVPGPTPGAQGQPRAVDRIILTGYAMLRFSETWLRFWK